MVKSHEQQVPHVRVCVLIRSKSPKIVAFAIKIAAKTGHRADLMAPVCFSSLIFSLRF